MNMKNFRKCCFFIHLFFFFSELILLGISYELSARQVIHRKCQPIFSVRKIKMLTVMIILDPPIFLNLFSIL